MWGGDLVCSWSLVKWFVGWVGGGDLKCVMGGGGKRARICERMGNSKSCIHTSEEIHSPQKRTKGGRRRKEGYVGLVTAS